MMFLGVSEGHAVGVCSYSYDNSCVRPCRVLYGEVVERYWSEEAPRAAGN